MHTSSLYLHLILLAATAATAEPAHPARQISVSGSAIFGRAVCNFGTECGTGCTEDNGSCCDNSAGIACPAGSSCTTINGQVGCCPEGKNCTWVRGCMDFNDGCQGNTCCPSTAPICDTQKKICVASSSASSSANSASTTAAPLTLRNSSGLRQSQRWSNRICSPQL
ncbi:hypothetical protein FPQ18DRAFT_396218 [Pyronema domesticum]|nr:hypothetical protein FPQ18DRAFT_396218 [Pyronema domesticum]